MPEPDPLFNPDNFDPDAFARAMQKPPATKSYVILFTPRSGSSFLTDITKATGRLSQPGECFNPSFVPTMAESMRVGNLEQFIDILKRRRNTHGVFGCQLTFFHLRKTFGMPEDFMTYFRDADFFWLLREDIVLQAVSLSKKGQTRIGHQTMASAEDRAKAEEGFVYDRDDLKKWVNHLIRAERLTENMIEAFDLNPLRLSYEIITRMPPVDLVNVIARHISEPPIELGEIQSGHGKIGTDKNAAFAEKFREDEAELIAEIEAERAEWLSKIDRAALLG